MRAILLLVVLAGCPSSGGRTMCNVDSDCGGEVCARDGECLPASQIYSVKTSWTIRGQMANATTCSATPDFYLQFDGYDSYDVFGYEPVPCMAGQFTIDKLPTRFTVVEIGVDQRFIDSATIVDGAAMMDLNP